MTNSIESPPYNFDNHPRIDRGQIVASLFQLSEEYNTIGILGDGGTGKSHLLVDLFGEIKEVKAIYHAGNFKSSSGLTEFYISLLNQLKSFSSQPKEYSLDDILPAGNLESGLSDILIEISKQCRRYNTKAYILIDDLDKMLLSAFSESIVNSPVFSNLPGIIIVFTAKRSSNVNLDFHAYNIVYLGKLEIREMYRYLDISEGDLDLLVDASIGIPEVIVSNIRLIKRGVPVDEIIKRGKANLNQVFEREWVFSGIKEEDYLLIGIILLGEGDLDIDEISLLSGKTTSEVISLINRVSFISMGKYINITSDAYHDMIKQKVSPQYDKALKAVGEYYESTIDSDYGFTRYANHICKFHGSGIVDSVMTISDVENNLKKYGNMSFFLNIAKLISELQFEKKNWSEAYSFSILKSLSGSIASFSIMPEEFRTYLINERYDLAESFINRISLTSEKLLYLSLLLNEKFKRFGSVDPDEINRVDDLNSVIAEYDNVSTALKIGASIYPFSRDTAVKIFEKALGGQEGARYMEAARARLSLEMRQEAHEILGKAPSDINAEAFVRSEIELGKDFDIGKLISEVNRFDTSSALLIIANWLNGASSTEDIEIAMSAALDKIDSDPDYDPSIRVLRQISEPLKSHNISESVKVRIINLAESLELSPEEELSRLYINSAIHDYKFSGVDEALLKSYFDIDNIRDHDIRCLVLSQMILDYVTHVDMDDLEFINDAKRSLFESFNAMLGDLAEHWEITKNIIRNTIEFDVDIAKQMALHLNTFERRDAALELIAKKVSQKVRDIQDINFLSGTLEGIYNPNKAETVASLVIINVISREKSRELPFVTQIFTIMSKYLYSKKGKLYCSTYKLVYSLTKNTRDTEKYIKTLERDLEDIDALWERVESAFWISQKLHGYSNEISGKFLEYAVFSAKENIFSNPEFSEFYYKYIYILIKIVSSFTNTQRIDERISTVERQISIIPSKTYQILLQGELAISLKRAKNDANYKRLIDKIKDIINNEQDDYVRQKYISTVSHVLAEENIDDFLLYLNDMHTARREDCIGKALNYLITNASPIEIKNIDDSRNSIIQERIPSIIRLIESMSFDFSFAYYSNRIVSNILERDKLSRCGEKIVNTTPRVARSVRLTLDRIAESKIPDGVNLKHKGYEIELRIMSYRLRNALSKAGETLTDFRELVKLVDLNINNQADKVFLYISIAEQCKYQDPALSEKILSSTIDEIQKIPSALDRSERSHYLARVYKGITSQEAAKKMLQFSLDYIKNTPYNNRSSATVQNIIELAHAIDPDYASSLSATVDNPSQRHMQEVKNTARSAKRNTLALKQVRSLNSYDMRYALLTLGNDLFISQILDNIPVKNDIDASKYLKICSDLDINSSMTTFAWYVNNSLNLGKPSRYFEDLFDNLTIVLDSAVSMAETQKDYFRKLKPSGAERGSLGDESIVFFQRGSRKEATQYIKNWIKENAKNTLHIYDPYFSSESINILEYIDPESEMDIRIYTQWGSESGVRPGDHDEVKSRYFESLKSVFAGKRLAFTLRVFITGCSDGKGPMHDRFIVSEVGGIDLPTSINGLGKDDNKIRILNESQARGLRDNYIPGVTINLPHYYEEKKLISREIPFYPEI